MLAVAGILVLPVAPPVLAQAGAAAPGWLAVAGGPLAGAGAAVGGLGFLLALAWVAWRQRQHNRALTRALAQAQAARQALAATEARLRRAQRIGRVGGFEIDLRSGENRRDAEYMELQGLAEADALERHADWVRRLHPDDRARAERRFLDAVADGAPDTEYAQDYRILTPTGEVRWIAARAEIERDPEGRAVRMLGAHVDVTELKAAEAAMRASDQRLALASAAAGLGVWDMNLHTKVGVVNAEYRALYGLPPADGPLPNGDWLACVHPEDRERMQAASRAAQAGQASYDEEFRIIRADTGEVRWVATRGSLVEGDSSAGRMVGVCYDVTERRQEQERQMLLAREVDHRAKNVLAVVQSIVKLTRASDPRSFAQAVEGRVAALARAHTLLSRDRWTGASLAEVVREELLAYGGGGRIVLDGPELWVQPDAVQSLSMVLHELATNAAKYGALSRTGGQVTVAWRLDPNRGGGLLCLDWTERGGPAVSAPPERRGFGSTVITATVRSHLEGEAHMTWAPGGLHCAITAPAGRVLAAVAAEDGAAGGDAAAGPVVEPEAICLLGRRVLVVEDEPLLALEIAATLHELGCEVVGPAPALAEALRLVQAEVSAVGGRPLDAAVMDVNLRGQPSFPIADLVARHGVAVIFVSGYGTLPAAGGSQAEGGHATRAPILLHKPLRDGDLADALRRALAWRAPAVREGNAAG